MPSTALPVENRLPGSDHNGPRRREPHYPSPVDWRDEVLYYLLPDRFSDGQEHTRPLLDRSRLDLARPAADIPWQWDRWASSGRTRWQGGTIAGVCSKLDYLSQLGVSTIWLGSIFKQGDCEQTYHGRAVKDYLSADPRLGTRRDVAELVESAHRWQMRVVLDVPLDDDCGSQFARHCMNWIAETDIDGISLSPSAQCPPSQLAAIMRSVREHAVHLGKSRFFLATDTHIGAANGLDEASGAVEFIPHSNQHRGELAGMAKGLLPSSDFFATLDREAQTGAGRISSLEPLWPAPFDTPACHSRFSSAAAPPQQAAAAVGVQLLTPGLSCIYYGTEQALSAPEETAQKWLPREGQTDFYRHQAMFGPPHPRCAGNLPPAKNLRDESLPGFGPCGTAGAHCFDPAHPAYVRIAAVAALRRRIPALRYGRHYVRPVSHDGQPFRASQPGELIAWSRVLSDYEALCVLNANGTQPRSGDILVDAHLSSPGTALTVVLNTAQASPGEALEAAEAAHPVGTRVVVQNAHDAACVSIRDLPPAELIVLLNHRGREFANTISTGPPADELRQLAAALLGAPTESAAAASS